MNNAFNQNWLLTNLTHAQRKTLALLSLGLNTEQLAKRAGVSVDTIRTHRQNLRDKLGLQGKGYQALLVLAISHADVLKPFLPPEEK